MNAGRWDAHVLSRGAEFGALWGERLRDGGDVLLVLGSGFDPRMCVAAEHILDAGASSGGRRELLLLSHNEGEMSPSHAHRALEAANTERLERAVEARGARLRRHGIEMWSGPRRIGSREAFRVIRGWDDLKTFSEIVVDISALPRSIYIPLLTRIMRVIDARPEAQRPNLHVVVAEDLDVDRRISQEQIDDTAEYVPPYASRLEIEAHASRPTIWLPMPGERNAEQLRATYGLVEPADIVVVLPSPSSDARRVDRLLLEYHDLIHATWRIPQEAFLYVAEREPFDVYGRIREEVRRLDRVLRPLGGGRFVVSAMASKLMSLGALLAVYELFWQEEEYVIGFAHAEPLGYSIEGASGSDPELVDLWLTGEPYRAPVS